MRWPSPRAQTAQPERWRMRRWSKEPRRMSVVEGREVASLARVLSVCFIYKDETIKTEGRVKSFSNIFTRCCFFDLEARLPPHRVRPGRNDDARLSAVARQSEKSEGRAKTQRMPSPLDFFAFPAPWRDTIFPL